MPRAHAATSRWLQQLQPDGGIDNATAATFGEHVKRHFTKSMALANLSAGDDQFNLVANPSPRDRVGVAVYRHGRSRSAPAAREPGKSGAVVEPQSQSEQGMVVRERCSGSPRLFVGGALRSGKERRIL